MSRYGSQETQRNFLSSSKSGKMEVGSSVKKANNFFIDQSINWIRLTRATENRGVLGIVPLFAVLQGPGNCSKCKIHPLLESQCSVFFI